MFRTRVAARRTAAALAVVLLPAALAVVLLPAALVGGPTADAAITTCSGVPQDINGDGFADVAVGEIGGSGGGGGVHVFYGTASGVTIAASGNAPANQLFLRTQLPWVQGEEDLFGATILVDDLNGDKCADVAVGDIGHGASNGRFAVLYGSPGAGLSLTGAQLFDKSDVPGATGATLEQFGALMAAGDFDDDGVKDLAVSAPFDPLVPTGDSRGMVAVFYGSTKGLAGGTRATKMFTQNTPNVPGTSEDKDKFGFALAAGDVTGDGVDDLVVGVPGENSASGVVQVLTGGSAGLASAPGLSFDQNSIGVPGVDEADDRFGYSVAVGDVTGDGVADVVVGCFGEDNERGAVTLLRSGTAGKAVSGTGAQTFTQATAGVDGVPADGDRLGISVAVAKLDGDAFADIAAGAQLDTIGSHFHAGSVTLLKGSANGATTAGYGGVRISQDTTGVSGTAESGDEFGFSVSGAAVTGSGVENLLIGAPRESAGTALESGSIVVLAAGTAGPSGTGSRTLEPGIPGVLGPRIDGGRFGFALD